MFLKKKGLMVSSASLFSFAKLILLTFHEWELRKIKGFHDIESWIWPSFYYFVISRRLSSNLIHTLIFSPLSSFHRGKFTPTKLNLLPSHFQWKLIKVHTCIFQIVHWNTQISTQSEARSRCRRKNICILLFLKKTSVIILFPNIFTLHVFLNYLIFIIKYWFLPMFIKVWKDPPRYYHRNEQC